MKYILIVFISVLIPTLAFADVRITEIAWMGTAESQYGEWIELHNDGTSAVDLAGWKIYSDGGDQILFSLSSNIPGGGYLLIERTTASMPDPVPGIADESGSFGGGGLSNVGEDLVLKDSSGNIVQSLSFASSWPAGNATTKETMQWDGSAWVSAVGTPKQLLLPIEDTEEEADTAEETAEEKTSRAPKKQKSVAPHIVLEMPDTVFKGMPGAYSASVALVDALEGPLYWKDGLYVWNMGDGTVVKTKGSTPHQYTYRYPGTYTVAIAYYQHNTDTLPFLKHTETVRIQIPSINVEIQEDGKVLEIKNNIDKSIDLSGWRVRNDGTEAMIPDMTILAPKASIVIPAYTLGIKRYDKSEIIAPDGTASGE
jgi:hypothetical protein